MPRITIRKLILAVVCSAATMALIANVERLDDPEDVVGSPRNRCQKNMRNLARALLQYHDANNMFPCGAWPNLSLPPEARLSWYVSILPDIEREDLFHEFDRTVGWNTDPNDTLLNRRPGLLHCPALVLGSSPGTSATNVIGIAGTGMDAPLLPKTDSRAGIFGYDRQTTLADIKDGAANTLIIVESGRTTGS
jgi:Protein of unknown function (DUF1559)